MKIFTTTAVFSNVPSPHYKHFGISRKLTFMYGVDVRDVVDLKFIISDNQTIEKDNTIVDYWGWMNNEGVFTLIYQKYFLLDMCFPNGIKATEEHGQGKAYKIELLTKT